MRSVDEIRGFHAHVYFDEATRAQANTLRENVAARFPVELGRWHDEPAGPHTKAMYQITLEPDQFGTVVMWLMLNREGLSILVHPRTGDEVANHSSNPLWLGEQLAIDIDRLRAHLAAAADQRGHRTAAGDIR